MKKQLFAGLMALLLLLMAACTPNADPEDSTTGEIESSVAEETETEPAEESTTAMEETTTVEETEETEETTTEFILPELEPGDPTVDSGFTISERHSVEPTTREEFTTVNVSGVKFGIEMNSIFYGTESAIDRDTFHWGDMIRYSFMRVSNFEKDYRVGDMDGDRIGELFTFENGELTVYKLPTTTANLKVVYSQTLGFDGALCGAGPLNDDGYTDLLLWSVDARRFVLGYGSADGLTFAYAEPAEGLAPTEGETLLAGDIDADGRMELVLVCDLAVRSYDLVDGVFVLLREDTLPFAESGEFLMYGMGDINSDGAADLICCRKDPEDGVTAKGHPLYGTMIYMSRLNGHFGSYDAEGDNKNINVRHVSEQGLRPMLVAGGDVTGDGVDDILGVYHDPVGDRVLMMSGVYPVEAPAYDYSSHIIKTEDGYILYTGGLYCDYNTDKYPETAADHITAYTSKDGLTWHRNLDQACFFLGGELGMSGYQVGDAFTEKWWYGNTMEPEVLFVDGTYYMYYQVENYTYSREGSLMGADRIGVATSTDGIHFERKTDSPAVISSDRYSCFTHQEVIYVPDDPDGKCFWMYVRYVHNNVHAKHVRIRSADPLCFNMDEDCTDVSGFNQIGNQIGYISDYDGLGNRLFVRITFIEHSEGGDHTKRHTVPTLQFSVNGIHWTTSDLRLAGADPDNADEWKRRNVYFIGFSTINGTGEIPKTADGTGYEFVWVACTCDTPVAPGIFQSSEGVGKAVFTVTPVV